MKENFLTNENNYQFINKINKKLTFILFSGIIIIVNYFCINYLETLEAPLLNKMNLSGKKYNFLLASILMPNFILPLIIGIILDKFGLNKIFIFGILFFIFGQFLIFLGLNFLNYYNILIGRVFFGTACTIFSISRVKFKFFIIILIILNKILLN